MIKDWTEADYLADRIVDVVNQERARMRRTKAVDPVALLAGQLRALLATVRRTPRGRPVVPGALIEVERAARTCLTQLTRERPTR